MAWTLRLARFRYANTATADKRDSNRLTLRPLPHATQFCSDAAARHAHSGLRFTVGDALKLDACVEESCADLVIDKVRKGLASSTPRMLT